MTNDGRRRQQVQKELFAAHLSTKAQNDRLLKWIVDDHVRWSIFRTSVYEANYTQQAFSVVKVPSSRSFVNGINPKYAIPTRKTITRRIVSTYASCLNYMKSRLHALDFKISLTYDVWTFFSEFTLRQGYGPRHQDLIMDTIQSFGSDTRVFSCVSDNEEATVQGLKAVKVVLERDYKNSAFQPLRCAMHTMQQLPLKKGFQECSKQLTSARDLGRPCEELSEVFSAYSEESIVTDLDEEDNLKITSAVPKTWKTVVLDGDDWADMKWLGYMLKPFENATRILGGDKQTIWTPRTL
ncbi:hypothetical protein V1522DRAFT_446326 [Lipomyces starkeyi]